MGDLGSAGAEEEVLAVVGEEVLAGVGDLGMDITARILMRPLRPTNIRVLILHMDGKNLSSTGEG